MLIGKRIPLKLSISIYSRFGAAIYPTRPLAFANATESKKRCEDTS
jgi:hypothetical protein